MSNTDNIEVRILFQNSPPYMFKDKSESKEGMMKSIID